MLTEANEPAIQMKILFQKIHNWIRVKIQANDITATLILVLLCLFLYLPGISSLPATDRDESRYMQATKQMVATGNVVDIRFQDKPRYKKPVGIYWLQATASRMAKQIGIAPTERSPYRLPSTIGATSAVLLLYLGFRKIVGNLQSFCAAVLLACSLLIVVEAHLAKTDAMQLAAIVAMQAGLAQIYCMPKVHELLRARIFFWLGLGVALLIKGPVAPVLASLTLAWICWKDRSISTLVKIQPWPWLLLPLILISPWLFSIQALSDGQFVQDSIHQDFFSKIISGQESHGAPPGTYLLITPFLLWPASWLLLPKAWAGLRRSSEALSRTTQFLCGWLVPAWIIFELVPTKLPHYVLPLIPPLCLLAGIGIFQPDRLQDVTLLRLSKWPQRVGMFAWIASGLALAIGIPLLSIWASGSVTVAALLIALTCIFSVLALGKIKTPKRQLYASALSAVVVFGLIFEAFLPNLNNVWPAEQIKSIIDSNNFGTLPVAAASYHEPSLVFNLGTDTTLTDLDGIMQHAAKHPSSILIVESKDVDKTREQLSPISNVFSLGTYSGFNYSKGKPINLSVLKSDWIKTDKSK